MNEYVIELNKLNYEHEQKMQKIGEELNDKSISINELNKLNNKYEKNYKK